jgi:hypothetical protein
MRSVFKVSGGFLATVFVFSAVAGPVQSASITTKVLKGAVIGFAVTKAAEPLDKFINTVTLRHNMKSSLDTKVVPILSVGEKGYIGGAQVSGPKAYVDRVKAVFQYEQNFSTNNYRAKVLVPSASVNPLKLERVAKVGVSALIDVALDGRVKFNSVGTGVQGGDVVRGAAVLVAVKNFGSQINKGLNTITFNKGLATKVVPMGSFGEKVYLGGAQVSASAKTIGSVNAVWQYQDTFDGGKFRVNVLAPTTSSNPLKMKRVDGAGITAVIDMSLSQQKTLEPKRDSRGRLLDGILGKRGSSSNDEVDARHDNGKHKGWYKGKRNGRKNDWVDAKWREKIKKIEGRD